MNSVDRNMTVMFEATASEFDFVQGLPKVEGVSQRKANRLAKCWEMFKRMQAIQSTEGDLLPLMFAAKLLDLSRTRMDQLIADGRLKRFDLDDHVFVTASSIIEFAKIERKNGRPVKVPTVRETFKMSHEFVQEACKKTSK